ncbi:MAG: hypothetical protein NT038_03595 [Euryarchaeota archaeon]|nr:hypothetical protein [Euryarchaeota archaeon]
MTTTSQMMQMFIDLHFIHQEARDILTKLSETGDIVPFLASKSYLWEVLGFLSKHRLALDDGAALYTMVKEHLTP